MIKPKRFKVTTNRLRKGFVPHALKFTLEKRQPDHLLGELRKRDAIFCSKLLGNLAITLDKIIEITNDRIVKVAEFKLHHIRQRYAECACLITDSPQIIGRHVNLREQARRHGVQNCVEIRLEKSSNPGVGIG